MNHFSGVFPFNTYLSTLFSLILIKSQSLLHMYFFLNRTKKLEYIVFLLPECMKKNVIELMKRNRLWPGQLFCSSCIYSGFVSTTEIRSAQASISLHT